MDVLSAAREEARARTWGNVYVLPPEKGDFRLDFPPGEAASFREGAGLFARSERGRLLVDLGAQWYDRAAAEWNAIPFQKGWSDDPDAHLCGRLLCQRPAPAPAPVREEERPLLRRLMEAPRILRAGKQPYRTHVARACAAMLRPLFARALAEESPIYALRACAAVVLLLLGEAAPCAERDERCGADDL